MSDEALMLAFQAGDRTAFDRLFERYRQPIWAFFRRRTSRPEDAEELAQDVFLAVFQGRTRYEPRAAFRTYLFGIAFNIVSAWRRREASRAGDRELADTHAAAATDPMPGLLVRLALAALDQKDQEIVMLREFDALSYAEIALVLDIPINTVRSRLFRARATLRAKLSGDAAPLEVRA
jgi:RNA polymerase sigma-70 factor (ECF subfamily)